MTLEASVVRLSDIIAYIGRDIEDAITIKIIKREDIPQKITKTLGNTNAQIVNTLIMDILENSLDKPYLTFSNEVFESLIELKKWNHENIYSSKAATKNLDIIENAVNKLYDIYLEKLKRKPKDITTEKLSYSDRVLYSYINSKTDEYKEKNNPKRIIIDYISGQTDKFFLKECEANIKNFKLK